MEEQQMKEIKTVKNLMNDEELMSYVTEDLEDFEEDTPVTYEVWAIGYDANDKITDAELFLGEFTDPDKAIEKVKSLTFSDVIQLAADEDCTIPDEPVAYLSIEVETVIADYDGTMNVGTIFRKELCVDESEDDDNDIDTLIHVKDEDYTISDVDGNLIISCAQFNHLNKNDIIKVQYDDEDNQPILTYKIISKTTSGTFECEFMY
jgi:hypothetical protein